MKSPKSTGYFCLALTAIFLAFAWAGLHFEAERDASWEAMARHLTGPPMSTYPEGLPLVTVLGYGLGLVTGIASLVCFAKVSRQS